MHVSQQARFSREHPCPVCGGYPQMPVKRGVRCWGMLSANGLYAFCTREDLAAGCVFSPDNDAYGHSLDPRRPCYCGRVHDRPADILQRLKTYSPALPAITLEPDVLHAVFQRYLELSPLRPDSLNYLASRGEYDLKAARAYGYGSLPTEENVDSFLETLVSEFGFDTLAQTPGFYLKDDVLFTEYATSYRDAVVIPAWDQHKQITGMIRRYTKGSPVKYKTFPGNGADFAAVAGPKRDMLWLTEGPHKAYVCAEAVNIMILGLPGTRLRDAHVKLIQALRPDEIVEALDADKTSNASVALQRARMVERLTQSGFTVRSAIWDIAHGKGLDDLLKNRVFPRRVSLTPRYCYEIATRLRDISGQTGLVSEPDRSLE